MLERRNFIKSAGIGITSFILPDMKTSALNCKSKNEKNFGFRLGIASFSMRKFSLENAIDMNIRCGVNHIALKSVHLPLNSSKQVINETVNFCKQKGVHLYGGGVIYMKSKAEVDQAFEYAKNAEMDMIIGVPGHELLQYVEEKVKQYDIKLAIHNHGPGDKLYPSAESAYKFIRNMDERMGLCIDIGHTKRINREPSQDLDDFSDRLFDIHIKDVTHASPDGKTCIIGRGVIDFVSLVETLIKINYKGVLALEYDPDSDDPLPGMMESLGYVKGVLATL